MVVRSRSKSSAKKKLVSKVESFNPPLKNWVFLKLRAKEVGQGSELGEWMSNHTEGVLYESQVGRNSFIETVKGKVGSLIR